MQTTLPKITPQMLEKNANAHVKPSSQFASPRSISEFTNLTKLLSKQPLDDDALESLARLKDPLNKQGRKVVDTKMIPGLTSMGFGLAGQQLNPDKIKSKISTFLK